jgi:hypothetical protein
MAKRGQDSLHSRAVSRRDLLKMAVATGLLAGCGRQLSATPALSETEGPTVAPTSAPALTVAPSPTSAPTAAPTVVARRPDVIQMWPDVPSKVVRTHHAGVWDGEVLVPEAIRQMLDASVTALTGLDDPIAAWQALFAPNERIAIKVNVFRNSLIWTHLPLVQAVTNSLQEAGVPAEQIVVFDYYTDELETAAYPVNRDGPGVRCYGTDQDYTGGFSAADRDIELSNILLNCDALINMPVLKSHMISGFTFALKNHYGSLSRPEVLHASIGRAMAGLNALPPIKDRTRLIVGDMLEACIRYRGAWPYWEADTVGDSILMSFDPVAHDTIGLQVLTQMLADDGGSTTAMMRMATPCLESSAELGLGTNDPANMELVEVNLG